MSAPGSRPAGPPPLRVLVVEDERLQRHLVAGWLRRLAGAGAEVHEAESGRAALDLAGRSRPDIVFLDLKMPGPDGLEVAAALRRGDPPPEIVFLTAYDEFRYAREAVRLGALDYLTKPVAQQDLEAAFARAAARVRDRRRQHGEEQQLRRWLRRALPALRAELIYDLVTGAAGRPAASGTDGLEARARLVGLDALPNVAMCFVVDEEARGAGAAGAGAAGAGPAGPRAVPDSRLADDLLAAGRHHPAAGRILVARAGEGAATVLAAVGGGADGRRTALEVAQALLEAVAPRRPGPVTAGVGRVVDGPHELPRSHAEALRAKDHRLWLGGGRVIPFEDLHGTLPAPVAGLGRAEQAVVNAIRLADATGLEAALAELGRLAWQAAAGAAAGGAAWSPYARLVELAVVFGRAAVEAGASAESVDRALLRVGGGAAPDEAAFLQTLRALACDALRAVEGARSDTSVRGVRRAMVFIRQHYARDLTLEDMARHVHLSPYYFSHLFKRETGRTFVEYLTEVRIDAACRLLAETDLYVTAVAARVGYRDPNYFCRVFKRLRGMTPRRYRQQAAAGR